MRYNSVSLCRNRSLTRHLWPYDIFVSASRSSSPVRLTGGTHGASLLVALLLLSWAAGVAVIALQLFAPSLTTTYALYPLLLSTVVLGLPHGALDHLLPVRLKLSWGRHPLWLSVYLLVYLALAGLYFGLWLLSPAVAFAGFLLMTIFHWGQGDLRFMELFLGRSRPTRIGTWLTLIVRGGLPIVLPVLAFPETAESLFYYAALGLGLERTVLNLSSVWLVISLALGLGFASLGYLVNAVRAAPTRLVLVVDILELVLLTTLFTLVPAYLAIGVYFTFWHSPRHLARLLLLGTRTAEPLPRQIRRLGRDVLPLTLVALALLGGLYIFNAARVETLEGFVALYLVLISSLTLPHTVVVTLLDVWQPAVFRSDAPIKKPLRL